MGGSCGTPQQRQAGFDDSTDDLFRYLRHALTLLRSNDPIGTPGTMVRVHAHPRTSHCLRQKHPAARGSQTRLDVAQIS